MTKHRFLMPLNLQLFAEGDPAPSGDPQGTTPTDPPKPESPKTDNMIPKSRFDEVNSKYKELAEQVAQFQAAEAERQKAAEETARKQAEEQGEFERLYKEAQSQIDNFKKFEQRSTELETVIKSMVETKLEAIPAEFHDLVPGNLSAEQTLDWINKAESKGLFGKKEPQDIGKPFNHSNDTPKVAKENMSALDKILSGLGG